MKKLKPVILFALLALVSAMGIVNSASAEEAQWGGYTDWYVPPVWEEGGVFDFDNDRYLQLTSGNNVEFTIDDAHTLNAGATNSWFINTIGANDLSYAGGRATFDVNPDYLIYRTETITDGIDDYVASAPFLINAKTAAIANKVGARNREQRAVYRASDSFVNFADSRGAWWTASGRRDGFLGDVIRDARVQSGRLPVQIGGWRGW